MNLKVRKFDKFDYSICPSLFHKSEIDNLKVVFEKMYRKYPFEYPQIIFKILNNKKTPLFFKV